MCTVAIILFILLSPGLLLTIPPLSKRGLFMSGKTSTIAVFVHAAVFGVALYFLRRTSAFEGFQLTTGTQGLPFLGGGPYLGEPPPRSPTASEIAARTARSEGQGPRPEPPPPSQTQGTLSPLQKERASSRGAVMGTALAEFLVGNLNQPIAK